MGLFDSKSDQAGGQVGSSDSLANNNAYASAPVFNIADERKGSGKYVSQAANTYNLTVLNSDYGAIAAGVGFASRALDSSDAAFQEAAAIVREASEGNRELALETGQMIGSAYDNANRGIQSAYETAQAGLLTVAASAERSSEKAMDYVFQSSKGESERILGTVIKWGAGLAAVVVLAPMMKRGKK